jgi:hypothetical protein
MPMPALCFRLCETLLVLLRLRVHMVLVNVCLFQLLLLLLLKEGSRTLR